jgi:hypothetical protein
MGQGKMDARILIQPTQQKNESLIFEAKTEKIIKRLAELSAIFGTVIEFRDGISLWIAK